MRLGRSRNVGKLKKFIDGGKYGCDWFLKMVRCLLDDVFALKKFMWHELTVFLLVVSEKFIHGVIDVVCCAISDICKISLLDCGEDLLNEGLIDPH